MLQRYWLAVGVLSAAATYLWMFRADRRVVLSSALASTGWGYMALTGGQLVRRTGCCETAVAASDALRFVLAAMAILSLGALILYIAGSYPPEQTEIPE